MEITRDNLITWFIKYEPELYKDMYKCDHFTDVNQPMKFHAEGSVWNHTLLAMTVAGQQEYSNILLPVMMLHDIGKPECEELITKRFDEFSEEQLQARFQVEYKEWWELPDDINIFFKDFLVDIYGDSTSYKRFTNHEGVSTMMAIDILTKMQKVFDISDTQKTIILELISLHGVRNESDDVLQFKLLRDLVRKCDKDGAVRQLDDTENIKYNQYTGRNFSNRSKVQDGKELIIMTGLICSGKSTFIKELSKEFNPDYILSRDDHIFEFYNTKFSNLSAKSKVSSYDDVYNEVHKSEDIRREFNESFDRKIRSTAKEHNKVIIDMTMMSLSSRRKMLNSFPQHKATSIVMMTGLTEVKHRNYKRTSEGKSIPSEVIGRMCSQFLIPTLEEGFEDVVLVVE